MTALTIQILHARVNELLSFGNLISNNVGFSIKQVRKLLPNSTKFEWVNKFYAASNAIIPKNTPMIALGHGRFICDSQEFNCFWVNGKIVYYFHDPRQYAFGDVLTMFNPLRRYEETLA